MGDRICLVEKKESFVSSQKNGRRGALHWREEQPPGSVPSSDADKCSTHLSIALLRGMQCQCMCGSRNEQPCALWA